MNASGWRPHIEWALCLDLSELLAKGAIQPEQTKSGGWNWRRGSEKIASVAYSVTANDRAGELKLHYSCGRDDGRHDVVCDIPLSSRPLPFGGQYWYMHCPVTGRRARKLYKFYGVDRFCHRTAIRPLPTYAIQRVSGSDKINLQRWALRERMGDQFSDLFDEPWRPKGMHRMTFQKYAARDAQLCEREGVFMGRLAARLVKLNEKLPMDLGS